MAPKKDKRSASLKNTLVTNLMWLTLGKPLVIMPKHIRV
jgi:hypothetical protein